MLLRTFGFTVLGTAAGLAIAYVYGGVAALVVACALVVLEISLSADNAVANARVLVRMSPAWQRAFLTVGILIAVFGMRVALPVLLVCLTAGLSPVAAVELALSSGGESGAYADALREAHPTIAAFGGVFLLLVFLDYFLERRDLVWLGWVERPMARLGGVRGLPVVLACGVLLAVAHLIAPQGETTSVLVSGSVGLVVYLLANAAGSLVASDNRGRAPVAQVTGKAALMLFLYLEVLDATFSFDGVVGAFAVTTDPVVIAIGLGVGALYVRSLTIHMVRRNTLARYAYLEHGAQWAIGALAVLLLLSMRVHVPEVITGLIGVSFIAASLVSSVLRNRRLAACAAKPPGAVLAAGKPHHQQ